MELKEAKEIVANVFNKSDVNRYKEAQRVIADAPDEAEDSSEEFAVE